MNISLVGHKDLAVECVWAGISEGVSGLGAQGAEHTDVRWRRPCEGASSGGSLSCGVSLQNRLALGSGLLLRVQEEPGLEGRLCRRAVRELGTPGDAAQSWMETSPEEGTHPPGKLKAAGLIQGFQVLCCKVKWFTISETSFPVLGGFFSISCHPCASSCCLSKGISVFQHELLLSPDKSHPILGLRFSHQKVLMVLFCTGSKQRQLLLKRTHLISCEYLLPAHRVEFCCALVGVFMFFPQLCK